MAISIHDGAYKDASPLQTVKRIKSILKPYGIQTTEQWEDSGVPHCYALRITVKGTNFSAYGKGVNKQFALASGYGELMERLQLGLVFKPDQQKGANPSVSSDESLRLSAEELLRRNFKWYSAYADKLLQCTGETITPEQVLARYSDPEGQVYVTPYYCVNTKTWEYLPTRLQQEIHTTTGHAAGNSKEEALVQAISEIMERHNQLRILSEGIAVPDIPEEVLQSCSIAYKIITFLRSQGIRVITKDCSLGQKFPVICVCLIDTATGKYHTHFGAFPDFEIALQRTLTESFQCRPLKKIGTSEQFCPRYGDPLSLKYVMRELAHGSAEKSTDFFLATPTIPYNESMGFAGKCNAELLRECFDFFVDQGLDILVRDGSSLGFPTYQIIIPGFSETTPHRLSPKYDDLRYRDSAKKVLRNPSDATIDDIMGLMSHLSLRKETKLHRSFLKETVLPAELPVYYEDFLMDAAIAHVYYTLGKTQHVLASVNKMLRTCPKKDLAYLICLKRYITLTDDHYSKEEIRSVLEYFHNCATVQELYQYIESNKNPFDKLTLHCDQKCTPDCLLYGSCTKKENDKLAQLVKQKMQEMDPAKLEESFKDYF